ncbi:MAG: PEP-CTERM sorting domain-containing protein [Planctomycetota bacterium]
MRCKLFLSVAAAATLGVASQADAQTCFDGSPATLVNNAFLCGNGRLENSQFQFSPQYPFPTAAPVVSNGTFSLDFQSATGTVGGVPGGSDFNVIDDGILNVNEIFNEAPSGIFQVADDIDPAGAGDKALRIVPNPAESSSGFGIVGIQVPLGNARLSSALVQNNVDSDGDQYFEFDLDTSQISFNFDIAFPDVAAGTPQNFSARIETGYFDFSGVDVFDPTFADLDDATPEDAIDSFTITSSGSAGASTESGLRQLSADGGGAYTNVDFSLDEGGNASFFFNPSTDPFGLSSLMNARLLIIAPDNIGEVRVDNIQVTGLDLFAEGDVNLDGVVDQGDIDDVFAGIAAFNADYSVIFPTGNPNNGNPVDPNLDPLVESYNLTPTDLIVSQDDALALIEDILGSELGDFDLSGTSDDTDRATLLANLGNAGGYADGDIDGDGDIDNDDLAAFDALGGDDLMGDANGDGTVDLLDLDILGANFGTTEGATVAQGDFNDDGAVDLLDLDILGANFGTSASAAAVPEPTSLVLAGLAVLGLARRRS